VSAIPSPYTDIRAQAPGTFVGTVPGSQAYVAIVIDDGLATFFARDGDAIGEWLGGFVEEGALSLAGTGDVRVTANVEGKQIRGELTLPDDSRLPFTAAAAVDRVTGLYRSKWTIDGILYVRGWIVTAEGIRSLTVDEDGGKFAGIAVDTGSSQPREIRLPSDADRERRAGMTGFPGAEHLGCEELKMLYENCMDELRAADMRIKLLYAADAALLIEAARAKGCDPSGWVIAR
jgi:hypothetical protein